MFTNDNYSISYVKEGDGRVALGLVSDGERVRLSVSRELYYSLGSPGRGAVLGGETLERLVRDDTEWRAMKKALSLLSASDKNKLALRRKLYECGFGRAEVEMALEYCVNLGYIDERRQLSILIEREANRSLRGREYIRKKLISKGYSSSDIEEVTDALVENGDIDFVFNFNTLCEKRGAVDAEARRILAYKYGYRRGDTEE